MAVYGFPHDGNRSQGTTPDTGDALDAELPVRCGFPLFNLQFPFKIFENDISAPDVTGGSKADLYRVANPKGPFTPAKSYVELMLSGAKAHKLDPGHIKVIEEIYSLAE